MDLTRMLREKKFYLAVLLAFLGIVLGAPYQAAPELGIYPSGTFIRLLTGALQSQTVRFLLPVAAVLPMGEEYLRERQWKFLRFLLIRRGRRTYCRDRVLVTAFSGALVWALAALLGALFFFFAFFVREEILRDPVAPLLELLPVLGRVLLTAGALSSFSAVCALLGGSVYLAFGLPFLTFYACMILRERYLEELYTIDPAKWIRAEGDWGSAGEGLWIFLLLLALLMSFLHYALLWKKLEEL